MTSKVEDQISYVIAKVGWHLDARRKAAASPAMLPVEQWRILEVLHERSGRSMGDLAQLVFLELPTLSKMIDRMVADALVYRSPDATDRRRVLIFLSDRGKACLEALLPTLKAQETAMAKRLGKAGMAALKRLSDELGAERIETAREPGQNSPFRASPSDDLGSAGGGAATIQVS